MPAVPTPFHQYAEEIGRYLAEDRERDATVRERYEAPVEGPSENLD